MGRKKHENHSAVRVLISVATIVAFVIAGLFLAQFVLKKVSLTKDLSCDDPQTFEKFIFAAWGGDDDSIVNRIDLRSYGEWEYLRLREKDPFLQLDSETVVLIQFKDSPERIGEFYRKKLLKKIIDSQFIPDKLSSSKLGIDTDGSLGDRNVYRKEDYFLSAIYFEWYLYDGFYQGIQISCGKTDKAKEKLFTELLDSPDIKKLIAQEIPNTFSKDVNGISIDISVIHDNFLIAGLNNLAGDYTDLWLQKVDGNWKVIYNGQGEPNCNLIRKNKDIPEDLYCKNLYTGQSELIN